MNLLKLRKGKKLTQADIGNYLNITTPTYNGYEKEKFEPTIDTLCKLADFYDVTLDYLVGREYKNDLGYLDEQDRFILEISKELTKQNKINLVTYASGLLAGQK